jgi:hypothetical protein
MRRNPSGVVVADVAAVLEVVALYDGGQSGQIVRVEGLPVSTFNQQPRGQAYGGQGALEGLRGGARG